MIALQRSGFACLPGFALLAAAMVLGALGSVQAADPPPIVDLSPEVDAQVQAALDASLEALALDAAAQEGRLALTLVDVTEAGAPRLAQVNGHNMMYAASLPKIAILLGAFHKAEVEGQTLSAAQLEELTHMIRVSSNPAATSALEHVGMDYLAEVLQSPRYRLYDPALNGGLWVGKPYGPKPATLRDPLHNISHGATTYQVARFYYLLETEQLVSPQASRQMKEILGSPGINHKFVAGLTQAFPDARIYRKSGSWRTYHADSALVERGGRRYIAVGLANDAQGGEWLRRLIVALDGIVSGEGALRVGSREK